MLDDSYVPEAWYEGAIAGDADAIAKLEMRADILDRHGETILHTETENGHTENVRFILREFAHKNLLAKLNKYKQTALHSAAYHHHTEEAEILIEAARHLHPSNDDDTHDNLVTSFQAFLRQADASLNTALHAAVVEDQVAIVKLLVEADPSDTHIQNDDGKTPMFIAVKNGFNDIAEIISTTCTAPSLHGPHDSTVVRIKNLDQGKSPGGPLYKIMDRYAYCVAGIAGDADAIAKLEMQADILNGGEETILHAESRNRYRERVRFILREFAKKNLLATLTSDEQPALHFAARYGHTEMAEILIDAARYLPPPPSHDDNTHNNPVNSFPAFIRYADEFLNTALHIAVMEGQTSVVKLMVEADPSDTHIQNGEGKTPMYIAVEKGYNDIVEIISTTCTAPSLDGPDGSTVLRIKNLDQVKSPGGTIYKIMDKDALYAAAIAGDADAISELETRADALNEYGITILHNESRDGNTENVRFILSEFASKNHLVKLDYLENTALILAAYYGHTEVVEVLIDAARHFPPSNDDPITCFQAFLRQANDSLNTALHVAVMSGHASTVKLLVEADPSDTHIQNIQGKTPMYIAVENEFNDIVEIISTTCTAPSLHGPDGSIALRIKNLDQAKSPGGTLYKIMDKDALYAAFIAGDADAIAELEMQSDKLDEYDRTMLHIESIIGNTERVRFILRHFASKNHLVKLDTQQNTALALAAYFGRTEVVEVLIDAARHLPPQSLANDDSINSFQAFLRHANEFSHTALHKAIMEGYVDIVKLLVEADPSDRHIKNYEGKTPIYMAAEYGYNEIIKVICTTCTAPSLDGPRGSTALHASIKHPDHDTEVVNLLIGAARHFPPSDNDNPVTPFQAFLRQGDEDLNTALHIAVMQGNLATAKLLVEADPSDTHIQNNEGKTPIFIAAERGYTDIVKVICTTCTALHTPNLDGPDGGILLSYQTQESGLSQVDGPPDVELDIEVDANNNTQEIKVEEALQGMLL